MRSAQTNSPAPTRSHRPRAITVFAAAFVAGAAAAVGVNRALDVRLAQSKPRVESEAIFVALRSLPQGAPVTVWDVALRDWPKAMMPASALRASDTFSGHVLKHPLREGQPLLSIQLAPTGQGAQPAAEPTTFPPPAAYTNASTPVVPRTEGDLWSPAEPVTAQATPSTPQPAPQAVSQAVSPVAVQPVEATPPATSIAIAPSTESSVAAAPAATPTQLPAQDTVSPQEPSAPTEPSPVEPTATVAAADGPAMPTDTTEPTDTNEATDTHEATDTTEATAAADVAPPPAPLAVAAPTPSAPVNSPRPTHLRYLVVPESIAVQADASLRLAWPPSRLSQSRRRRPLHRPRHDRDRTPFAPCPRPRRPIAAVRADRRRADRRARRPSVKDARRSPPVLERPATRHHSRDWEQ